MQIIAKENLSPTEVEGIAEGQAFREEQDKIGSQYLSGQSLARDRATTAKTVVFDVGRWKHHVNVRDFAGYDVKRGGLPEKTRHSVEELMDNPQEAERIAEYLLGKGSKQYKINDFDSFKQAFKSEFTNEGVAGTRLWDVIGNQEDLLLKLYATTGMQGKVTIDSRDSRVIGLMTKYHVNKSSALEMYNEIRKNEIGLVQKGMLPIDQRESVIVPEALVPTAKRNLINQKIKQGGINYQRTSPKRFSEPQIRFLRQNKETPIKEVTAEFNLIWKDSNKTEKALYFKRYRLGRGG